MFTIIKGFASKFCFCLGLGTATYYSYGQVQQWVHHDEVKVVETVTHRQVNREQIVENDSYVPQSFVSESAPIDVPAEAAAVAPVESAPVVAAATEEKKEEEKKEESAEKKEESSEEVAGGMIVPNQNYPMAYVPQTAQTQASNNTSETDKSYSPEIPLLPNALPTATPGSSSGSASGYVGSSSTNFSPTSGALDSNDIAALIAPMKASFEDEMVKANGLLCVNGEGRPGCDRRNHVSVHSLRWGMAEGLKKDVKFTIKSLGGTAVEFDFNFKIQNSVLAEESVSLVARPYEVLVHHVPKDSKNYRVIEFKFSDLSVRGDVIKQVQATMIYEVTPAGLVLSQESGLSFSRSKVQLLTTLWSPLAGDPTTPVEIDPSEYAARRAPAAQSGFFLIADELVFSMKVEKSL